MEKKVPSTRITLKPSTFSESVLPPTLLEIVKEDSNITSFVLDPARLINPLEKDAILDNNSNDKKETDNSLNEQPIENGTENETYTLQSKSDFDSKSSIVVPKSISDEDGLTKSVESSSGPSSFLPINFVFGQNIRDRIEDKFLIPNTVESSAIESSDSEMLFSSAGIKETDPNVGKKTLSESARELDAARSAKRKYDEVAVVTGEEDEKNILQINCKLYTFDSVTMNWIEKGRGVCRVNDKIDPNEFSCRLIMRACGSYRLMLNAKIWNGMTVERPGKKSVRFTAVDNGQVKIHLLTSTPASADQLYEVLTYRVQQKKLKSSE